MSSSGPSKRQKRLLQLGAILAATMFVPGLNLALLPLGYLYTYIHELAHAFAAILGGGTAHLIKVFMDGSGVTYSSGAPVYLVSPAGYVGAAIVAGGLILAGSSAKTARIALTGLAAVLGVSLLLLVRGDAVGVVAGAFWFAALLLMGRRLSDDHACLVVQFLGIAMAVTSLQAVLDLFGMVGARQGENDAVILQEATGVPALLSALLWVALSFTAVGAALWKTWTQKA